MLLWLLRASLVHWWGVFLLVFRCAIQGTNNALCGDALFVICLVHVTRVTFSLCIWYDTNMFVGCNILSLIARVRALLLASGDDAHCE